MCTLKTAVFTWNNVLCTFHIAMYTLQYVIRAVMTLVFTLLTAVCTLQMEMCIRIHKISQCQTLPLCWNTQHELHIYHQSVLCTQWPWSVVKHSRLEYGVKCSFKIQTGVWYVKYILTLKTVEYDVDYSLKLPTGMCVAWNEVSHPRLESSAWNVVSNSRLECGV